MSECKLTIYFDNPFWVGVFERFEDDQLSVGKVIFGAEPKDCEVWEFLQKNYAKLRFSASVPAEQRRTADNPKRRQRTVRKQLESRGIGTKSQQALAAEREQQKIQRKQNSRLQQEAELQRRFELKQQKKKEKHRGH